MKKSIESFFFMVVLLTTVLSGCALASTPIPPTFTPSSIPPTFTLEPTATATLLPSPIPPTFTPEPTATATPLPSPTPLLQQAKNTEIANKGESDSVITSDNANEIVKLSCNILFEDITSLSFHPNKSILAATSFINRGIVLLRYPHLGIVGTLIGSNKLGLYSVAFSKSGTQIAAGSDDGTIMIWEVESKKLLHTLIR